MSNPPNRPPVDLPRDLHARPDPAGARQGRVGGIPSRIAALVVVLVAVLLLAVAAAGGGFGQPAAPAAAAGSLPASAIALQPGASPDATPPATDNVGATASDGSTRPTASAPAGSPTATASATATPTPAPSGTTGKAPDARVAKRLQVALDKARKAASIPGVSVAILWDDGRTWLGVSGSADVARKRAMTPDTGFALASISKTFTAAVVLQLVDEGRVTLKDSAAKWLPAYHLDPRITVRMLLDHTSGLPDFFFANTIDHALRSVPDAAWTPARTWKYVAKARPTPGKVWRYSNTNYLLLGELVTAVTGRPLATEIRDRLLDPLRLDNTWYQAVEGPQAPLTVGYRLLAASGGGVRPVAVAPRSEVMPFRSVVTAAAGAGSIAATARDTARWMRDFAGGRVVSSATHKAMLADASITKALRARIPYGLGIQLVPINGHKALGHSGRYLGFRNVVRYLPNDGVTIAVLTNQGAADPAKIASALLKIVLPPSPAP